MSVCLFVLPCPCPRAGPRACRRGRESPRQRTPHDVYAPETPHPVGNNGNGVSKSVLSSCSSSWQEVKESIMGEGLCFHKCSRLFILL